VHKDFKKLEGTLTYTCTKNYVTVKYNTV